MPEDSDVLNQHAMALGHIIFAWGRFQDNLAHLFSAVMCGGLSDTALASWHAYKSDLAQRQVLLRESKKALETKPEIYSDIEALLSEADEAANTRNMFIHASYAELIGEERLVIAHDYYGNRRSVDLVNKYEEGALLIEMQAFRLVLEKLVSQSDDLFQQVVASNYKL